MAVNITSLGSKHRKLSHPIEVGSDLCCVFGHNTVIIKDCFLAPCLLFFMRQPRICQATYPLQCPSQKSSLYPIKVGTDSCCVFVQKRAIIRTAAFLPPYIFHESGKKTPANINSLVLKSGKVPQSNKSEEFLLKCVWAQKSHIMYCCLAPCQIFCMRQPLDDIIIITSGPKPRKLSPLNRV